MQTPNPIAPASASAASSCPAAPWQQVEQSFAAGEHETAESMCREFIAAAPEKPMAYALMARLCLLKGQVRPATSNALLAGQRAEGSHWTDILAISSILLEVGESQLAHGVLSFVDRHDPANLEGLPELGKRYGVLNDQANAAHCIELARSLGNPGWFADQMLGASPGLAGSVEEAIAACENSIARAPKCGQAHWLRAKFAGKECAEQRVARMRAALTMSGQGDDDATYLHFAIFRELDALGRAEEAWPALVAGANARRRMTEFSVEKENRAFDALIRVTAGKFLDRCAAVPTDVTPIFVVGMPRSGAALLQRVLGNHPQIAEGGAFDDFRQQMQWVNNVRLPAELDSNFGNFVAHLNYNVLGRRYLDKTRWRTEGKSFFCDTQPTNFMHCGMILRALPHAKIIHLRRHPLDSCFSSLKELFDKGSHRYSYALDELANHYRNYDRLMRHWHAIAPGRILDLRQEELLAQPKVQARRVQEYLGLANVEAVSPQLRPAACVGNAGGWRRYQQRLAPLLALLAEHIDAYEEPGRTILMSRL